MSVLNEDDRPKPKVKHSVGEELEPVSVEELGERIALLTHEIERLEAARQAKQVSRNKADAFFKI